MNGNNPGNRNPGGGGNRQRRHQPPRVELEVHFEDAGDEVHVILQGLAKQGSNVLRGKDLQFFFRGEKTDDPQTTNDAGRAEVIFKHLSDGLAEVQIIGTSIRDKKFVRLPDEMKPKSPKVKELAELKTQIEVARATKDLAEATVPPDAEFKKIEHNLERAKSMKQLKEATIDAEREGLQRALELAKLRKQVGDEIPEVELKELQRELAIAKAQSELRETEAKIKLVPHHINFQKSGANGRYHLTLSVVTEDEKVVPNHLVLVVDIVDGTSVPIDDTGEGVVMFERTVPDNQVARLEAGSRVAQLEKQIVVLRGRRVP
ncbi:MAG: hypothetical protein A3F26_03410 [Candidatus Ryanbacteria bacterium RIFCSPHIGHO2_12_FULL_47_12b]|uniref:Uncharacterized protein n=2 Tax=Candidatus Ryaniibacteriota TaxID=1817914 RepID=A0A1G2H3R8_9BACT|nr:MAG: hypothetical protein UY36_C0006G0017 [Parcubacteria group bacterium GW2011_GWA1_49_11]OGZ46030.1 MAG: hypothetical protein A2844_02445 [Candidatus Ryanbacteria bacterium RIFCSPHIGHO2_01_FULL_48_80]OGZ48867.1 MAG: hypothetical protein A3C83_01315 [Candidatus Ryanbacteria bacterium RIFCSPHIGHO2_02_FULL_47_25]OGZ53059.1 MAG: hypothetical protein A3F26_03410 [Candidatus Ryanbacteria bacterium RIFCSPHIGHO2_12_FULL_47_12b]OGZ53189.1 MAG: hypothetical protein A3A29_02745 [Candidatus Ryanbacter